MKKQIFILFFFTMPTILLASASFYKCSINGVTVYSEKPCSENAVKSTTEDVYIGNKNTARPKTAEQQLQDFLNNKTQRINKKRKEHKNNACENVSTLMLRNAAIKEKLMKCHSEKDVISIYGDPSNKTTYSDSNYHDQHWKYKFDFNEGYMLIYFKDGFVTKWTQYN